VDEVRTIPALPASTSPRALVIVPWICLSIAALVVAAVPPLGVGYLASGLFAFPVETGDVLLQLRTTSHELLLVLPLIAALGIALAWRLRSLIEVEESKAERMQVGAILGVAGAIWLVLLWTGLQRHWHFQSNAYDMGIFTQVFNNLAYRSELSSSIRGLDNMLADHALCTWWAFAPLMRIWPGAETLIILQWICLAAASWPLWLLARSRLSATGAALVLLTWAAYPPLHWFGLFDVHEHALTPVLALSLIWCWERRNWKWAWAFALLWLGVKEEVGILLFALALHWIVTDAVGRRHAIGMAAMAIGWFVVYTMVIQPSYRTDDTYYYVHRYAYLGDSMSAILTSLVTKPDLWVPRFLALRPWFFVGLLLFPLALLPIKGWKWLLVLLPTFFYSVLAEEPLQTSIYAQYTAPYFPFLFMALIDGLAAPGWSWASATRGALLAACLGLASNLVLSPLAWGRPDMRIAWERERPMDDWQGRELLADVRAMDPSIPVVASSHLVPHLATHPDLRVLTPTNLWKTAQEPHTAVRALADTSRAKSTEEREALWSMRDGWDKEPLGTPIRTKLAIWANYFSGLHSRVPTGLPTALHFGHLSLMEEWETSPRRCFYLRGIPPEILQSPHYFLAAFDGVPSRQSLRIVRPLLDYDVRPEELPGIRFLHPRGSESPDGLSLVVVLIPSKWGLSPEEWVLDQLPALQEEISAKVEVLDYPPYQFK